MSAEMIVQVFIPIALAIIMLGMGLGLTVADFQRVLRAPRAVAVGAAAQLVVLPAVSFAIAALFHVDGPIAVGLVLVSACPGGPTSNFLTGIAGGDVALSVTLTAVSSAVTMVTLPLIMRLALNTFMGASDEVTLPVLQTIAQIALVVVAPIAAGMWLRARAPLRAAQLERVLHKVSIGILVSLVVGATLKERARITDFIGVAGWPVLALNLSTMALGWGLAKAARLGHARAVTISIEVGMQNAALAIGIALGLLHRTDIAIPAVLYGILVYFTCGGFAWWISRVKPPSLAPTQ
jgi:BASS family bile acid:Na+ symporter